MIKSLFGASLLAAALAAGAAMAQTGALAQLHAGTIVETRADGTGAKFHFNPDGTFMMMAPQRTLNGTYIQNDKGEICISMKAGEAPDPKGNCVPLPLKTGGSVDHKGPGPNGQMEHFVLTAGR